MKNLEKLEKAGLVPDGEHFTREEFEAIENLSPEDVDTFIRIWKKLTPGFKERAVNVLGQSITAVVKKKPGGLG